MLELITKFKDTNEVAYVDHCNEFRDGFIPNESVTSNEELLMCTIMLQSRDTTFDNPSHAHPEALGHKNKSNLIDEKSYINGIN